MLIIAGGSYAGIHLGDSFSTAGTLSKTKPGDRAAALLRSFRTPAAVPAEGLLAFATDLRTGFADRASVLGDADAAGLLPSMVHVASVSYRR